MQRSVNEELYKQLARDFCCRPEEIASPGGNLFRVYRPLEGRRRFEETDEMFLKIASVHNKLLFTGREDVIALLENTYAEADAAWFMEAGTLRELSGLIEPYGWKIGKIHPFLISLEETEPEDPGCEIRMYERNEIEQFRGDSRFRRAYSFLPEAPDVIGIAAIENGRFLGMAGASADSPQFWQIGIDVMPEARGRHLGRCLVKLLKNEIIKRGKVPYYGTAFSHTLSLNIAIDSGFRVGWTELITERLSQNTQL